MEANDRISLVAPVSPEAVSLNATEIESAYQEALTQAVTIHTINTTDVDTRRSEYGAVAMTSNEAPSSEMLFFDPTDLDQLQKCTEAALYWRKLALKQQSQGDFVLGA